MAANDRLSLAAMLAWLRVQMDRIRRSSLARRPLVRWGSALAVLIGLSAMVYLAATSFNSLSVRYILSGRRFSSDDLIAICRALDKQRVGYRVDDVRRVEVSTEQFEQASDAVAKLDLGHRSLNEIREESIVPHFLESMSEREHKDRLLREKTLERLVSQLEGVVWSLVSINRPATRKWQQGGAKPTAFVYIETEGQRRLPFETIRAIPDILAGYESDLKPGSITVMDTRGYKYFESGNLAVGVDSHNKAREEELKAEVLDKLEWIKGVRVQVKVPARRSNEPAASPGNVAAATAAAQATPRGSAAAIIVNQPADSAELESTESTPAGHSASDVSVADVTPESGLGHKGPEKPSKDEPGRVLISVPRSYYLNADTRGEDREPNRDDLRTFKDRTEENIKKAVSLLTPPSEPWIVDIITFPDKMSVSRPLVVQSPVDTRRRVLDWGIVGTVVGVISIVAAVGSWFKAARRPLIVPDVAPSTRHYHIDSASEPGPSERVRELVRRNPEAAASVLQRWTAQGGIER